MMDETGESYTPIVAMTPSNKAEGATPSAAETDEPRGVPQWNLQRDLKLRALLRESLQEKLEWIRQLAARDHTVRFTTLWHHVYDLDRLAETFFALRKDGAVGVDNVDWASYDEYGDSRVLRVPRVIPWMKLLPECAMLYPAHARCSPVITLVPRARWTAW